MKAIKSIILTVAAAFSLTACAEKPADYVFLFIGDGMGNSQVAAADSYLSYKNGVLGGEHMCFTQFPVFGLATSYSANNRITDSSAAGTAIASGVKTNNGWIGVDTEENPVGSMAFDFRDLGYKVAVTSSVPVNHATPGSFYGADRSRGSYYKIATQIAESGFDFFSGAGILSFNGKEGDQQPIDEYLEENGYNVCYGLEELAEAKENGDKVVLLPPSLKGIDPGNYVIGHAEDDIRLSTVVEDAINFFGEKNPFFVMCEGGEIDWACHANQTMPMIDDIFRFDEAIKVAYEFYLRHPKNTLIVVTADHETGGITLGKQGKKINWEKAEEIWDEANARYVNTDDMTNSDINDALGIGWTTGSHTGAPVPVYAVGKGAEKFSGMMDNTDIIKKILCRE